MGWLSCVLGFLYVTVSLCWPLLEVEPEMYGEVKSPQYPKPYAPNLLEQWDLSVPEGFQIRITFTHLDIDASPGCHYDALTVYNGKKVLGKFCGSENSADGHHPGTEPLLSPGNTLTLVFKSDSTNPERHQNVGFSAHYQAIDMDECAAEEPEDGSEPLCSQICLNTLGSYVCSCHHGFKLQSDQRSCALSCNGGLFDEPKGHLASPGYPSLEQQALTCRYVISVPDGFTVSLNFSDSFHIESIDTKQGPECLHHWLQVSVPDQQPYKLCGDRSPGVIVTSSSSVTLDYHTDADGWSRGWSLDYSTHRVQCPSPGSVAHARVTPTLNQYLYRDHIFVRCDTGYKLMMDGEELRSFSAMCQSNGQWHLPLPECHIIDCGEPERLLNGGFEFVSGYQNQYQSVIKYHCNQPFYAPLGENEVSFTCDADRSWRSINDLIVPPLCLPVCGQSLNPVSGHQRIIGGNVAQANSIPWQVLLSISGNRAGGMVIADRWILTAAHVLTSGGSTVLANSVRIYMGLNTVEDPLPSHVNPTSIHIHPEYNNPNLMDFNNDIALIKLQDPVTFSESVMPVCLPGDGSALVTGDIGVVSGFGITNEQKRRILTNRLKYVSLPVVDQGKCNASVIEEKNKKPDTPSLTDNMFCAGLPEGGKDSCQGDSGSPFTISHDNRAWAAGIVSWGIECGRQGVYGVYTSVTKYLDWINKTMQEN
uniref:complement subcomponent C1r n=2 Tax=Tetraodon nigroviridis TaxID=99883 RepID=H3C4L9_TETNG